MPDSIPPEQLARFLTTRAGHAYLAEIASLPDNPTTRRSKAAAGDLARFAGLLEPHERCEFGSFFQNPPDRDLVSLALRIVAGRERAKARYALSQAEALYLTEEMLAQATSPIVSAYHASGLSSLGSVTDLCCGAGRDSIAFARAGMSVVAVDNDPARVVFAQANAGLFGVADAIQFHCADAIDFPITTAAVFADPARRTESGTRVSRYGEQYLPPLSRLQEIASCARGACLKLSPLLPDEILHSLGGRIEFLSENRECKEACVWFGEAYGAAGEASVAAVILPERIAVVPTEATPVVRPVGQYVYEPDPAVIRGDAVATLAEQLGIGYISPEDVYLTGDRLSDSPAVRAYRVIEAMPFHRKEVAAFVRKAQYGRVVVKRRRARMEPEALLAEIKASNRGPEPEVVLILVREARGHSVVFCTPVRSGEE